MSNIVVSDRDGSIFSYRKSVAALLLLSLFVGMLALPRSWSSFVRNVEAASPDLVISQVYGGGGNSGATLKNDFIEIFNRGSAAVSLNGKSVQYASSTGSFTSVTSLGSSTLQPGQY